MSDPCAMTHREKIEYLLDDLKDRGIDPRTTAPGMFRLLWL
jgi:hypothetical protein